MHNPLMIITAGYGITFLAALFDIHLSYIIYAISANDIQLLDGRIYWDDDNETSWSIFEFALDVLVGSSEYQNLVVGDVFGSTGSIVQGNTGFGNFLVTENIEEGDQRRLSLFFQQVDYYEDPLVLQTPSPIPAPAPFLLLLTSLVSLVWFKRRR